MYKRQPYGLAGEAIPRVARIVAIADVYDALTSERPYKAALSHSDAIIVMRSDVGRQFDPALFALFERVAAEHADAWVLQLQVGAMTGLASSGERRHGAQTSGAEPGRAGEPGEDALLPPIDFCRFQRTALDDCDTLRGGIERRGIARHTVERRVAHTPASGTDVFPTAVRPLLARLMHDRMRSSRTRLFQCRDARAFRSDAPADYRH